MSFQKLEPTSFEKFTKRPIIEGADITNNKENVYNKMGNEAVLQQNYNECSIQNDISCNEFQTGFDEKRGIKNTLEEQRNAAKIEYEGCDVKLKTCKLLYSDLNNKTTEFKSTFDAINTLHERIRKCGGKKIECQNIDGQFNSRKQKCKDDYDKECPSDLSSKLNEQQSLYANIKSTVLNLEDSYEAEECKSIKSCDNELQASNLASSNYNIGLSDFTDIQTKTTICKDPYRNKCSPILNDLEKSREDINSDIVYMQDMVEGMTIQNNIDNNTGLNTLLDSNNVKLANFNILQSPNKDSLIMIDNEVCKNIVLTTISSVMLYYLFFEI
jgi:hypothetical protein